MNFGDQIRYISITFFMICVVSSNAQIAVTNTPPFDSEESVVTNVLLGTGIVASNFSSIGFANGIGYFDGFSANIGFQEGVILSTGGLEMVTGGFGGGSGVSGDADLELALNEINLTWGVNNVTVLEFDFVAESESMAFNYVFGSTEYTSYTCSSYNDIFGFFLSGPGIAGPYSNNAINLAYVPDPEAYTTYEDWLNNNTGLYTTTPVAVNTINAGSPTYTNNPTCDAIDPDFESYNIFWIDNDYTGNGWDGPNEPPDPEFTVQGITGFTTPLTAEYNDLICGETYHIKLAIADAADGALNSAVFLEANSFASPEVDISTVPNTELGNVLDLENGVLEGCGEVAIQFDRGGDMSMDLNVTITYSGDATYGVDYAELPTELVLPAFQEQIILPIDVFFDDVVEGEETLIVTISGVPVACEEVTVQDVEIIILDQEELLLELEPSTITIDCLGEANIEADISGGYAPYSYTWYNESGNIIESDTLNNPGTLTISQSPTEDTYYTLVVVDDCLDQVVTESVNIIIEDQPISVSLENDILLCESEFSSLILEPDIAGGIPPYTYTWFYNGSVISNEAVLSSLPGEGLYQFIAEEACGGISADEISVSFVDLAPYVELISYDVLNPALLPEACFQSLLQFNIPVPTDEDIVLEFSVGGTADIGIDYDVDTLVTIPAGEDVFFVPISIFLDGETEGVETIEFDFPFIDICSNWPTQLTIQIYEPPTLSVELPSALNICEEEVSTLEGFFSGGVGIVNYSWYHNNEVISTEMDLSTIGLDPGIYSFVAIDECGNISASSINFSITPLSPVVSLSSNDYTDPTELYEGCGYSTLTFQMPYAYSVDTIFYYNLIGSTQFVNGLDIDELSGYVQVPAGVTEVNVDINPLFDDLDEDTETLLFDFPFANACLPQDYIELNINNYSPLDIDVPPTQVLCVDQSLFLEAEIEGGVPPYNLSWSYLSNSSNSDSIVFDVVVGEYAAIFTVEDACGFSLSSTVMIEGLDVSPAEVVWPPNEVFACFGDNSELYLEIQGGLPPFSFQWFLDDVEVTNPYGSYNWNGNNVIPGGNQIIGTNTPYTPYVYDYSVTIIDSCSNEQTYDIEVTVDDCILPTSFSPNGDGNNDFFWLNFGDLVEPVSLDIFNRWGSLVFRAEDYSDCVKYKSECWDGTYFKQFGQQCSEGIYYYILTYSKPIYNVDAYDVSPITETLFGGPHNRNDGRHRTGSLLLVR